MSQNNYNCHHDHILCTDSRNQISCNNSNNMQFFNGSADNGKKYKEFSLHISNEVKNISNFKYSDQNYFLYRKDAIKSIKNICKEFFISDKTYFLTLYYLDKIYETLTAYEEIIIISTLCLILAIKFIEEDKIKAKLIKDKYLMDFTSNFSLDEIYVLKLLNYNLSVTTSYDTLIYLLLNEIVFFGDEIEKAKNKFDNLSIFHMAIIYLLKIVENQKFLLLTPFETAFGIIQIIRKKLGLNEYRKELYDIYFINGREYNINKAYEFFIEIFKKRKKNNNNERIYRVKTFNKNYCNSCLNCEELRI